MWPLGSLNLLSTPLKNPCSTAAGSAHLETTRSEPTTSSREIFISFLVEQLTYDEQGDISVIKSGELSLGQWEAEKKIYKLLWAILRNGSAVLFFPILKHIHFTLSSQCVRLAYECWFTSSSMIHDPDQITMPTNLKSETKTMLPFFLEF